MMRSPVPWRWLFFGVFGSIFRWVHEKKEINFRDHCMMWDDVGIDGIDHPHRKMVNVEYAWIIDRQ